MTSSTHLIAPAADLREVDDASEARDEETCDVCPHPRAGHDAIAARFCSATGTGAIARGCVCPS